MDAPIPPLWLVVWAVSLVLIPIVVAVAIAAVAVLIVGPRDLDSLIIPSLVTAAALAIAAIPLRLAAPWILAAGAAAALLSAAVQRETLRRLPDDSPLWIPLYLVGSIAAGVAVAGVIGIVAGLGAKPLELAAFTAVGAVVGAAIGRRAIRPVEPADGD